MISTLIHLLGSSYESKDYVRAESIAHRIHGAIPGDQVSLKFLGLVYYHTGRIVDAMKIFERVQGKQTVDAEPAEKTMEGVDFAETAVSREAGRRVPYLAQAWRELGNALARRRGAVQLRLAVAA